MMSDLSVGIDSIREHLSDMLNELAELADGADDDALSDLAFKLRLLTAHPCLRQVSGSTSPH